MSTSGYGSPDRLSSGNGGDQRVASESGRKGHRRGMGRALEPRKYAAGPFRMEACKREELIFAPGEHRLRRGFGFKETGHKALASQPERLSTIDRGKRNSCGQCGFYRNGARREKLPADFRREFFLCSSHAGSAEQRCRNGDASFPLW